MSKQISFKTAEDTAESMAFIDSAVGIISAFISAAMCATVVDKVSIKPLLIIGVLLWICISTFSSFSINRGMIYRAKRIEEKARMENNK